jgi:hypothetical protein
MPINSNISGLRQKLKAWRLALEGLSPSRRRLVLLLGSGGLVLLLFVAVINPLISLHLSWTEELDQQRLRLARYEMLKGEQGRAARTSATQKDSLAKMQGRFLSGTTAMMAAAELQDILKNLTESYGLQVSSTKVLPPRQMGPYQEVPLEVQLIVNTGQLLTLLYRLEDHRKLLFVSQLEIIAPPVSAGTRETPPFRTRLTISGVIKAAPPVGRSTI